MEIVAFVMYTYCRSRYGRDAGGLNIDADSIDTDAVDLLKYPGWGELEWSV